ncbi:TetR/AcrR family transcriptional regulator [Actinoallomurus rhizosphaericola]|uniref:TetR/AcrR family transcriptional regulator n=1 Tax=Actinoallomurus rhizosphaericola TaxID=2952536 RepID=UPI0020921B1E|nr:TetR/AcrR family transcriptional regulator [Actinoallomurus rhizosphaericola]MCO5997358.1 TetR/AcrR family transcriptional regulator [Actinoallomurus rhizosphaericola]
MDDEARGDTDVGTGPERAGGARELTRQRIVEAAADLLTRQGRDAVTTRAVAAAAGVQAPVIYRLFGDKDGLLEAVAGHGYAAFLAAKHQDAAPDDPVEDLRAGWNIAVEFGLANPELFTLMYGDPGRGTTSAAFQAGMRILRGRIRRIAAAGRLRVDEELAAALIHATTRGAVLTWLSLPESQRDPALLTTMRESMVAAVTYEEPAVREPGLAAAARAMRVLLPGQTTLSDAEEHLLGEWLGRLAANG